MNDKSPISPIDPNRRNSVSPPPPLKPAKRRSVELPNSPANTDNNTPEKSESPVPVSVKPPPPLPPKPISPLKPREPSTVPVTSKSVVQVSNPIALLKTREQSPLSTIPKNSITPPPPPPPAKVSAPVEKPREQSPITPSETVGKESRNGRSPVRNSVIKRPSVFIERRNSVKTKDGQEDTAILVGTLSKRNRDGNFEKYIFTLTKDALLYQKQLPMAQLAEEITISEEECKSIPLIDAIVAPLKEGDYDNDEKKDRAFRFLSKFKSFLLRAKTVEMKDEWFQAIQSAALQTRIAGNTATSLDESEMAPIWNPNETECSLCFKAFSFFVRKHHCRNCGICVCELCSKDKVRIPKLDERTLFKVCNHCSKLLKETRVYGFQSDLTA